MFFWARSITAEFAKNQKNRIFSLLGPGGGEGPHCRWEGGEGQTDRIAEENKNEEKSPRLGQAEGAGENEQLKQGKGIFLPYARQIKQRSKPMEKFLYVQVSGNSNEECRCLLERVPGGKNENVVSFSSDLYVHWL